VIVLIFGIIVGVMTFAYLN